MVRNEWRYIRNSRDCYIDLDGEVRQEDEMIEPYPDRYGHRKVTLLLETNTYDYENNVWLRAPTELYVWHIMMQTWFTGFPLGAEPYFIDGDMFNCAANNLRAQIGDSKTGLPRVVHVREEPWGYSFDLRKRGPVEIVETGEVYSGVAEVAKHIGGSKSGVSKVLAGDLEKHHGFHFRWR
jgi:hypothetical protein